MTHSAFQPLFNLLRSYKNIPAADEAIIAESSSFCEVKEGEVLLKEGQIARSFYFVCDGILKIVGINEKGNDITLFFVKEQRFCTILNSFLNNVAAHESIVAATDAKLIVFSRDQLFALYERFPYFKELIENITRQSLLDKIQLRNELMGEDASIRYQKFLNSQPDIALRVPLSDVASYLGITQQSLSRIRRNLSMG